MIRTHHPTSWRGKAGTAMVGAAICLLAPAVTFILAPVTTALAQQKVEVQPLGRHLRYILAGKEIAFHIADPNHPVEFEVEGPGMVHFRLRKIIRAEKPATQEPLTFTLLKNGVKIDDFTLDLAPAPGAQFKEDPDAILSMHQAYKLKVSAGKCRFRFEVQNAEQQLAIHLVMARERKAAPPAEEAPPLPALVPLVPPTATPPVPERKTAALGSRPPEPPPAGAGEEPPPLVSPIPLVPLAPALPVKKKTVARAPTTAPKTKKAPPPSLVDLPLIPPAPPPPPEPTSERKPAEAAGPEDLEEDMEAAKVALAKRSAKTARTAVRAREEMQVPRPKVISLSPRVGMVTPLNGFGLTTPLVGIDVEYILPLREGRFAAGIEVDFYKFAIRGESPNRENTFDAHIEVIPLLLRVHYSLPVSLRSFRPFVGAGSGIFLTRAFLGGEALDGNDFTTTKGVFGFALNGGGGMPVGPGDIFAQIRLAAAYYRDEGSTNNGVGLNGINVGGLSFEAGYRLRF